MATIIQRNFAFPNFTPGKYPIPPDFKLLPDIAALDPSVRSLPDAVTLPPVVRTGDLITASHENMVTEALSDLWADVQYLDGTKISDPTTAKGDLITRDTGAIARLPAGSAGQILTADASAATGLKWATLTASNVGAVPATRQVIAGAGMSGGGALAADVTLTANILTVFGRTGAVVGAAGDYAASQVTNAVDATQSYTDPAWLTINWTKINGKPSTFPPSAHTHAATDIVSGVIATARLGTGAADATVFLRGDGTWAVPPSGGGGTAAGSTGQIQYNNGSGAFAATSNLTWDIGQIRLGVGTSIPQARLHVVAATGPWVLMAGVSNNGTRVKLGSTAGSNPGIQGSDTNDNVLPLVLNPEGGNVGIGTTSPPAKLSVATSSGGANGNWYDPANYGSWLHNSFNNPNANGLLVSNTWRAAGSYCLCVDGRLLSDGTIANDTHTPYLIVRGDGNVGIGIASPTANLDVEGGVYGAPAASGNAYNANLRVCASGHGEVLDFGASGSGAWLQSRNAVNYALNFPICLNPNGGGVGIGTLTPRASTLSVVPTGGGPGSIATATQILIGEATNNAAYNLQLGLYSDGTWKSVIQSNTNGPGLLLLNPNGGLVGIATNAPAVGLDVNTDARFMNKIYGSNAYANQAPVMHIPDAVVPSGMPINSFSFYVNSASNQLVLVVKYGNGTQKSVTLALS